MKPIVVNHLELAVSPQSILTACSRKHSKEDVASRNAVEVQDYKWLWNQDNGGGHRLAPKGGLMMQNVLYQKVIKDAPINDDYPCVLVLTQETNAYIIWINEHDLGLRIIDYICYGRDRAIETAVELGKKSFNELREMVL